MLSQSLIVTTVPDCVITEPNWIIAFSYCNKHCVELSQNIVLLYQHITLLHHHNVLLCHHNAIQKHNYLLYQQFPILTTQFRININIVLMFPIMLT